MYEKWNMREIKDLDSKLYTVNLTSYYIYYVYSNSIILLVIKIQSRLKILLSDGLNYNKFYLHQKIVS